MLYQAPDKSVRLEVRLQKETVWLSQKEISVLFGTQVPAIAKHIRNIYVSGELKKSSTLSKMEMVQKEGSRSIQRSVETYNLDMIISVGYRVNSSRATQFRIWATNTLKDHLVQGYTLNKKRLLQQHRQALKLQKAVAFLQSKAGHVLLQGHTSEILQLVSEYARALSLFEQYDQGTLHTASGKKSRIVLTYADCRDMIGQVQQTLLQKKEAGDLFGQEVGHKFEGIIHAIYQTFGKKELYASIEEKAAHLLYFTIKDHPFVDGNKRIASLLFVYFLQRSNHLMQKNGEKKINDTALVALTLLIAISEPREKGTMVKLIINLIS